MNTKHYDLIVLGFGKAGKTLAAKFGSMGKAVAMIEENPLMYGGTCINIACIPTKTMIVAALGYLISPLDVIPDAIPIAGLGDDLGVLLYVLRKVWTDIPEDVKTKAHDKLSKWFDEEEVKEADSINL